MRFEPDDAAMRELLTGSSGPVVMHVTDESRKVDNDAKVECPVDTGNMRARHEYTVDVEGQEVIGHVGTTADYGMAVHEGHKTRTAVSHQGRTAVVSRKVPGNNWLERAMNRNGYSLRRGA